MAEMIWNGAVTVYDFIMDNIVIINILFALIIVFFQRRSPQTHSLHTVGPGRFGNYSIPSVLDFSLQEPDLR